MDTPLHDRRRAAFSVLWSTVRSGTGPDTPGLGERARALPSMVRDSVSGEYRGAGRRRLAASAAGLLYLLSPVDVLPELLLPLVGLLDDGVVAAWVAGSLLVATEDYARWRGHGPVGAGPAGPPAVDASPLDASVLDALVLDASGGGVRAVQDGRPAAR